MSPWRCFLLSQKEPKLLGVCPGTGRPNSLSPAGCRAVCEMLREMQRCRAESRERRSAPPGWTAPPSSGLPRELQPLLRPGQTLLPSEPGTHTRGQHSCYVFDGENIVDAAGCCPKEMLRWGCSCSERETPGDTSNVCKCLEPDSDVQ